MTKVLSYTLGADAGEIDELYSAVRTLSAGASEEVDIASALTNVVNQANAALARVKVVLIQLLSSEDDAVNGTAASSITVGNATTNPFKLFLSNTAHTLDVPNGGFVLFGVGDAAGLTVSNGSADRIKVVNNDGGNPAAYRLVLLGASS